MRFRFYHFCLRHVLFVVLITQVLACNKSNDVNKPVVETQLSVGAIRWDAWTGGSVTDMEEITLGSSQFQERAPFFTQILTDSTISINGNSQEIMTQEINFALQSGIDY